jgi:hypothetical protein
MGMMFTNTLNYDMQGRKRKRKVVKGETYKKYKPKFQPLQSSSGPVRRDEGVVYKSNQTVGQANSTALRESQKYTGTLIKGIATMHKSNAVPILNEQEATDIANMRRN